MKQEILRIFGESRSGKTEFLVEKFRKLLKKGVDPADIFVFCPLSVRDSFAEKLRLEKSRGFGEFHIDNFSGFSKWAVRKHYFLFDINPNFKILSGRDEEIFIRRILSSSKIGKMLDKYKAVSASRGFVSEVMDFVDNYKISKEGFSPPEEILAILDLYNTELRRHNLLDLRDVERYCLKIAQKGFFKSVKYVFLDGWEDLNLREIEIFLAICDNAAAMKGIYIAGDKSEGIFSFLGADAERNDKIIRKSFPGETKILKRAKVAETEIFLFSGIFDEAKWVFEKIKSLVEKGVSKDEIAVIVRDIAEEVKFLEDFSQFSGFPITSPSGAPFFKKPWFVRYLSFLFWVCGMENLFDLNQVLAVPIFGLAAHEISRFAMGEGDCEIEKKISEVFKKASSIIERKMSVRDKFFALFEFSGIAEKIRGDIALNRLFEFFFNYVENISSFAEFPDFPSAVSLFSDMEKAFSRVEYLGVNPDAVKIYTVHQAKGRHFRFCFVMGVMDGNFPRKFEEKAYVKGILDEETHYQTEKKIFESALNCASEKTFLTFRKTPSGDDAISMFLKEKFPSVGALPLTKCELENIGARMVSIEKFPSHVKPTPTKISASAIENYIKCPLVFFVENLISVRRADTVASLSGRLIHEVLRRFHEEFEVPSDEEKMKRRILEIYEEIFEESFSAGKFPDRFTYACWKNFYRSFIERYPVSVSFSVEAREMEVKFKKFPIVITGRIDRIDRIDDGFEIIDYKTSVANKFGGTSFKNRIGRGEIVAIPIYFFATKGAKRLSIFWIADKKNPNEYPRKVSLEESEFSESADKMFEKVAEAVGKIIGGDIFPSEKKSICYNCGYKYICEIARNRWKR